MKHHKKKKNTVISRRKLLFFSAFSIPAACSLDAFVLEPKWLNINHVKINPKRQTRIVHFSDLHYRGNDQYTKKVINTINSLSPDFICFTGDIVEKKKNIKGALDHISNLKKPVYGVPGNHDYCSGASFDDIRDCFSQTGGAWIENTTVTTSKKSFAFEGKFLINRFLITFSTESRQKTDNTSEQLPQKNTSSERGQKNILLAHHPETVNYLNGRKYDLILAGHSHGGQVRVPFAGSLILTMGVGPYDKGLFKTPSGPLYVNVGIGTWRLPVRFCCRPEITVIEI